MTNSSVDKEVRPQIVKHAIRDWVDDLVREEEAEIEGEVPSSNFDKVNQDPVLINRLARRNVARKLWDTRKLEHERAKTEKGYKDELTGLPNRNAFEQQFMKAVDEAVAKGDELSLMFYDNEGLKVVNDTISQDAGDALLAFSGTTMRTVIDPRNKLFRYGGDEWLELVYGGIADGKKDFEAIDRALQGKKRINYPTPEGEEASFEREVRIRGTLVKVDADIPYQSLVRAKALLRNAKAEQKKAGGNLLVTQAA
jgi:diguanylate cyclase (GGDEF)-like protein